MADPSVRVLDEQDWALYRDVRLLALRESPGSFTADADAEAAEDEEFWRRRMGRSLRFLAEQGGEPAGIVSLGHDPEDATVGEVFGLYVDPQARTTGVSWRLVQAAAERARRDGLRRLTYWVGTENARAIAFAVNFGFRAAGERRPARSGSPELGEQEVAMTLSLGADPGSVPNPTSRRVTSNEGPQR